MNIGLFYSHKLARLDSYLLARTAHVDVLLMRFWSATNSFLACNNPGIMALTSGYTLQLKDNENRAESAAGIAEEWRRAESLSP